MGETERRAVVTGIGIITANGNSREEVFEATCDGRSGLGEVTIFDMSDIRTQVAGEVKKDIPDMTKPDELERMVNLAMIALTEALEDSVLKSEDIEELGAKAGITISTSLGGNLKMMNHIKNRLNNKENSYKWITEVPGFVSTLCDKAGVKGPCYTTISACAAGTAGASIALDKIRSGKVDLMVVGGADPLTRFSISGFHSLKTMSATGCRPFDISRDGIIIGEGSAFLIVESLERALNRGAHIYGEILGYGLSNDAYHSTSPDPSGEGAYYAMKMALEDANLTPKDINYLNAHGTGTKINDSMEINAISKLYKEENPELKVSSTKSMTGHCLGAAGSIELAISLLSIERGIIPPTATLENVGEGLNEFDLVPKKGVKAELNYVMSNSFAFAGNNASIVVGKYKV